MLLAPSRKLELTISDRSLKFSLLVVWSKYYLLPKLSPWLVIWSCWKMFVKVPRRVLICQPNALFFRVSGNTMVARFGRFYQASTRRWLGELVDVVLTLLEPLSLWLMTSCPRYHNYSCDGSRSLSIFIDSDTSEHDAWCTSEIIFAVSPDLQHDS